MHILPRKPTQGLLQGPGEGAYLKVIEISDSRSAYLYIVQLLWDVNVHFYDLLWLYAIQLYIQRETIAGNNRHR